jgi:hypothetical protein
METIQYQYSLKYSLGTIILMIILMLLLFLNVVGANNKIAWVIYGIFMFVFLFLLALLVIRRLIPALKGNIVLELDEQGISDYITDVSIGWNDIKEIDLIRGRSASTLRIRLKWESDYGNEIAIPLRWIKGKDREIYDMVIDYFERDATNTANKN